MGYRSDVAIIVVGPKKELTAKLTKLTLSGDANMVELIQTGTLEPWQGEKGWLRWACSFESIKWYEGDPFVEAAAALLDEFEKVEDKFSTRFIRVGEEDNDMVNRTTGHEWIEVFPVQEIQWGEDLPNPANDVRRKEKSDERTRNVRPRKGRAKVPG